MGFYEKHILPPVLDMAMRQEPIMKQRAKVIPGASGVVLEVGVGSGLNLAYYEKQNVEKLYGLDPSVALGKKATVRAGEAGIDVELIPLGGESIPLDDGSIDTVTMTYTLCTIPDGIKALSEMKRVLKPDGRLLFCEHGARAGCVGVEVAGPDHADLASRRRRVSPEPGDRLDARGGRLQRRDARDDVPAGAAADDVQLLGGGDGVGGPLSGWRVSCQGRGWGGDCDFLPWVLVTRRWRRLHAFLACVVSIGLRRPHSRGVFWLYLDEFQFGGRSAPTPPPSSGLLRFAQKG